MSRKLCSILTPGTFIESQGSDAQAAAAWKDSTPLRYSAETARQLMAVTVSPGSTPDAPRLGAVVIDAAVGTVHAYEWVDDARCTQLRTRVADVRPVELLMSTALQGAAA